MCRVWILGYAKVCEFIFAFEIEKEQQEKEAQQREWWEKEQKKKEVKDQKAKVKQDKQYTKDLEQAKAEGILVAVEYCKQSYQYVKVI